MAIKTRQVVHETRRLADFPGVRYHRNAFLWKSYLVTKRIMDVAIAVAGLIVLSPLFLVVALAIWIESGAPIIFEHDRVGKNGKLIRILKFRTMYTSAPKYSLKVAKDDPRVTTVGRFLRRSSIDELPQLINVLKGEMSLVGPRPEQPWIVERFYKAWQYERFTVLPGITGWWQVNGRSERPMHEATEMDLYYIQNQSLWLDVLILMKTVVVVINGRGAR